MNTALSRNCSRPLLDSSLAFHGVPLHFAGRVPCLSCRPCLLQLCEVALRAEPDPLNSCSCQKCCLIGGTVFLTVPCSHESMNQFATSIGTNDHRTRLLPTRALHENLKRHMPLHFVLPFLSLPEHVNVHPGRLCSLSDGLPRHTVHCKHHLGQHRARDCFVWRGTFLSCFFMNAQSHKASEFPSDCDVGDLAFNLLRFEETRTFPCIWWSFTFEEIRQTRIATLSAGS
jgi:hypothetical protein